MRMVSGGRSSRRSRARAIRIAQTSAIMLGSRDPSVSSDRLATRAARSAWSSGSAASEAPGLIGIIARPDGGVCFRAEWATLLSIAEPNERGYFMRALVS
jgi:hypothetical protein